MRVENEEEEEVHVLFIKSSLCLNLTLVDSCENHYGVQFCQPLGQSTNAWAHDIRFKMCHSLSPKKYTQLYLYKNRSYDQVLR